jgi:hypothetical protein
MVNYLKAITGALLIGWTAFPPAVQAQAAGPQTGPSQFMCGEHTEVVSKLEKGYSETPANIGMASNGTVIEVFASSEGTFTIIMTQPSGLSCLMAAGDNWERIKPPLEGSGV